MIIGCSLISDGVNIMMKPKRAFFIRGSLFSSSIICPKDSAAKNEESEIIGTVDVKLQFPPPNAKKNWVGPPHPVSNLRHITFVKLKNEGCAEQEFREKRIKVQEWNQAFWEQHNNQFKKMKEEFICATKKELPTNSNATISAEEMSKFYKKFLDDTYQVHLQYNKTWYKNNVGLLLTAINAFLHRIVRKVFVKGKS